jgi:hypothetical protein
LNNREEEIRREIPVYPIGVPMEAKMERLMLTTDSGYDGQIREYTVSSGKVNIVLPRTSGIILKYAPKVEEEVQEEQHDQCDRQEKKPEKKKLAFFRRL